MTRCQGYSSKCLGGNGEPYYETLMRGERRRDMCLQCVAALNGLGMHWQPERRVDPARPQKDATARRFVPVWRRNLTAKDMTGTHR